MPLVAYVILVRLGAHFCPTMRPLRIASHVLLTVFFGFLSVVMFAYLGRPGVITSGLLYASVRIYLILGIFWFSAYSLIETIHAGSFVLMAPQSINVQRATLLYFSWITLTTIGYGDVLPATPTATRVCGFGRSQWCALPRHYRNPARCCLSESFQRGSQMTILIGN